MKSRNLTPQEILSTSGELKLDVNSLFDSIFKDSEGNIYPMYSSDEIEARQKYPLFATAFSMFSNLWRDIPEPRREKLFNKMETLIKNIKVMDSLNDWRACPTGAKKWYMGQLDPDFYEENDELFYEWIIDHVETDEKRARF
jgi:hypothetical protein